MSRPFFYPAHGVAVDPDFRYALDLPSDLGFIDLRRLGFTALFKPRFYQLVLGAVPGRIPVQQRQQGIGVAGFVGDGADDGAEGKCVRPVQIVLGK